MSATNVLRTIRDSGVRLGPLDAAFAGLDYYEGRQQGEDDIRASAGAAGSTAGGWGGAMAGAKIGAGLGAFGGPVGAVVGGTAGSVVGGIAGSFAGGYGADRVDETLRGNNKTNKVNNMATINQQTGYVQDDYGNPIYDDYGNPVTANNYNVNEQDGWGSAALTGLGLGMAAPAAMRGAHNFAATAINPRAHAARMYAGGMPAGEAARRAARSQADDVFRSLNKIPGAKKALGVGGLALAGNQLLGNPLGKLADTVTGQRTNFDNDPVSAAKQRQNEQYESQQQAQQKQQNVFDDRQDGRMERSNQIVANTFEGRKMPDAFNNNPYDEMMRNMSEQYEQKALDRTDYEYARNFRDNAYVAERSKQIQREDLITATRAEQAKSLVDNYTRNIPNSVANQMRTIFSSRY